MPQVVGEHRDGAVEIGARIGAERGEARQLVEHEGLAPILFSPLELLGREQGRRDVGRGLRE